MLLVFIDETTDRKFNEYLGFCIATVNATFYPTLKRRAQAIVQGIGWDPTIEFKGSYLFSASSGCTDIDVERRILAAGQLLDLNVAKSNSRMRFYYGRMASSDHRRDYLEALPALLHRALPRPRGGAGKALLSVMCDERSDISPEQLHQALVPPITDRGYTLLERASMVRSSFDTVGIMFADIVCYLAGRIDTISHDAELFRGLSPEQFERNGKIRKLRSSKRLIAKVKHLGIYTHADPSLSAA